MQSEKLNIPDSVAHLSEAQSLMLESHDSTLITHNEEINTLKQNFGVHQPSILVSTESQYLQVLSDIRIAALAKNGQVCSTLRLTDATLPLILPCPQALCDRDITVMKMCTPPNYCANNSDVIYIQSPQPHTRLGIMTPGSNPFDNFVYRSNPSPALNITGCKAFKLSPETSSSFIVSGTAISGGIKSIPPRSICGVKKVAGTLIIWIMLESLDTSTGKK